MEHPGRRPDGASPPAPARRARPTAEAQDVLAFFDRGGTAYFGYRMVLAAKLFDRAIARILALDGELTLPEWRAMAQLGLRGEATVRTIADASAVDRAEASRAVRALTARGFAERRADPADLRSPRFRLTPAGAETMARIRGPILAFVDQLVGDIDRERLDAVDEVLRAVTRGCLDDPA